MLERILTNTTEASFLARTFGIAAEGLSTSHAATTATATEIRYVCRPALAIGGTEGAWAPVAGMETLPVVTEAAPPTRSGACKGATAPAETLAPLRPSMKEGIKSSFIV